MFRFTIRELVLVTVIAAMAGAWWLDHRQRTVLQWQLDSLVGILREDNFVVHVGSRNVVFKWTPPGLSLPGGVTRQRQR